MRQLRTRTARLRLFVVVAAVSLTALAASAPISSAVAVRAGRNLWRATSFPYGERPRLQVILPDCTSLPKPRVRWFDSGRGYPSLAQNLAYVRASCR
jgi:hypothetical protein